MSMTRKHYDQKIIYILGNGFDLSADLPTRYTDFMFLIEHWDEFYDEYSLYAFDKGTRSSLEPPRDGKLSIDSLKIYSECRSVFDETNIEKLDSIIKDNLWIKYFAECGYKKDGWAGFENEIRIALIIVDKLISRGYLVEVTRLSKHEKAVYKMIQHVYSDPKYRSIFGSGRIDCSQLSDESISNYRRDFLTKAAKALLEFSEAFRLYLNEFVEKMDCKRPDIIVNSSTITYVISLNYTNSQLQKTGLDKDYIHMIHGTDQIKNNLVLGIENDESLGNEFIRFKKFFQRIQKRTGSQYKKFFNTDFDEHGNPIPFKIVFFGHSLDPIDRDFIKDVFDNTDGCVYIHHCDQKDYEQKVINCVDLFGADYVINAVETGRVVFTDKDLSTISLLK